MCGSWWLSPQASSAYVAIAVQPPHWRPAWPSAGLSSSQLPLGFCVSRRYFMLFLSASSTCCGVAPRAGAGAQAASATDNATAIPTMTFRAPATVPDLHGPDLHAPDVNGADLNGKVMCRTPGSN